MTDNAIDATDPGSVTRTDWAGRPHGPISGGGLRSPQGLAIDSVGNVWVANNWSSVSPIVGGDGLVEFIGAAPPVKTLLIGPPRRPWQARALAGAPANYRLGCQKAISPAAGAATTLRQPAGPSRGSSSTEAPSWRARSVTRVTSATST